MLELQKYLADGNTLESLQEKYGVYNQKHSKYEIFQFSYDQIESSSNKNHPIVLESRGIILDKSDNWKIVAFPFTRFFNHGEPGAAEIDWFTAQVQEKLDGSMMILYFYDGEWRVATRGSIEAQGDVGNHPFTFSELFWTTFKRQFFDPSDPEDLDGIISLLNTDFTYIFELVSKYNKVVVDWSHEEGQLYLIGIRNNKTYQEIRPEKWDWAGYPHTPFPGFHFRLPPTWPLTSFSDVIAAADKLNPMETEGYVICDAAFNRVKIKSPKYVAVHHLVGEFAKRRIIELIQLGEAHEVFSYFKDTWMYELYQEVQEKLNTWSLDVTSDYLAALRFIHQDMPRKDIAKIFKSIRPYPDPLFQMWDRKVKTANEYLLKQHTKKIEELIEP